MLQRTPSKRARRRAQHRERQARCRERAERGELVVSVVISQSETAKLLAYRFLGEHELESPQAIGEALRALIARLA